MIAGRNAPLHATLAPLIRALFSKPEQRCFAVLRETLRTVLEARPEETLEGILARNPRALPLRDVLESLEEAVFCSQEMLGLAAGRVERLLR